MRNAARALATGAVSALLLGLLPGSALAAGEGHVDSRLPAAGSVVTTLDTVRVIFDGPILAGTLEVNGPGASDCSAPEPLPGDDSLACTPAVKLDGDYTVTVTAEMALPPTDTVATTYAFRLDTTGPTTTVALSPAPYLASTTAGTPVVVSGVVSEPDRGAKVLVSLASSGSTAAAPNPAAVTVTSNSTTGAWSATFPGTVADGVLTATAVPKDSLGNAGPAVIATTLKDRVLPQLVDAVPASGASQRSAIDLVPNGITVTADEALSGTSTIVLAKGDVTAPSTLTFPTSKSIKATPTTALAEGTYTATVTLEDVAGNAAVVTRTFVIDDTAPASPVFTPVPVNDATKAAYVLNGTGEPGATVSARIAGTAGTPVTGTAKVSSIGAWRVTKDVSALPDGVVTVSATQTDAAGNTSSAATKTTTKDVEAPAAPVLGTVTTPVTTLNQTAVTVTGTAAEAGATVLVTVTGGDKSVTGTAVAAADKSFTVTGLDATTLPDGPLSVSATNKDAAGNVSAPSATSLAATKKTALPTATGLAATATSFGRLVSSVTGKASEAGTVVVKATDGTSTVTSTVTAAADNSFATTLSFAGFKGGTVTVTAVVTDAFGNVGQPVTATTTHDSAVPPGAPAVPTAFAGDRSARVFFAPPSTGGAPITSYVVQALVNGQVVKTAFGTTSPVTVSGLLNGVEHAFQVRGVNRAGTGAWSPASNTVLPLGVTRTTLATPPTVVKYGNSVTLKGTVSRSDTSAPFDEVAVFVERAGLPVRVAGFATPTSTGSWSLRIRPPYTGTYTAVYGGDEVNDVSYSGSRRTAVRFLVTAKAPTGSHTVKQVVSGKVGPTAAGRTVYLYKVRKDGTTVKLATTKVSSTGTYRFAVKLAQGSTKLRVVAPGSARNAAGWATITAKRT